MIVELKIYQSDGVTLLKSYSQTLGSTLPTEDMTFFINSLMRHQSGNYGICDVSVLDSFANINYQEGCILHILNASTIIYVGSINKINKDYSDKNPAQDIVHVSCVNVFDYQAGGLLYTLKEDDGSLVSTTLQDVYDDIFDGGSFSGKHQENITPIIDGSIITYNPSQNAIESFAIDISFDGDKAVDAIREAVDIANGNIDQSAEERYIWQVKSDYSFITKQRAATVLATFDYGTSPFYMLDSADLDDYKESTDKNGIINKVIINGVDKTTSSQYSTEITASRADFGLQEKNIPLNENSLPLYQTTEWMDGWIYGCLDVLTTYELTLKKDVYGGAPFFSETIDGYISITKDEGTPVASVPLISIDSSLTDSSGWNQKITCGYSRPLIDTRRIMKRANTNATAHEPDTQPPNVSFLSQRPTANEITAQKVINPIYLGAYASDNVAISTVKFYCSKWTDPNWSAYTLIGIGTWNAPPDSDSQGYYEYPEDSGYYNLVTEEGYVRGDRFRIKTVAKDTSGNAAEVVNEYILDDETPNIAISILPPDTAEEQFTGPSVLLIESPEGARLRIDVNDLTTEAVECRFYKSGGYDVITVTKIDDAITNEHYYLTDNIAKPSKAYTKRLDVIVTSYSGVVSKATRYIGGADIPIKGPPMSVYDYDTAADEETTTVTEYTDKVGLSTIAKEKNYIINVEDIKFNIYNNAGTLVKTLTSVSTPAIVAETPPAFPKPMGSMGYPTDTGRFYCNTTVAALALSSGVYTAKTEITMHENFVDDDSIVHDGSIIVEGETYQFRITGNTAGYYINDHGTRVTVVEDDLNTATTGIKDRLVVAEKELNFEYDNGNKNFQFRFFDNIVDTPPDNGAAGVFATKDSYAGTPTWYRVGEADADGTLSSFFTVNSDNTSVSFSGIKFKAGGTDIGCIQFDKATLKLQATTNYQDGSPTWIDIMTGVPDSIQASYAGTVYQLKINDSDGSLTFTEDPEGTPNVLFTLSSTGEITVGSNILPKTDGTLDLGSGTNQFKDAYLTENIYLGDAQLEWDATNGVAFPHKIAMGFIDD